MNYFKKAEPVIFYLLVFIHALPVITLHFFPTVDGPAHLYNSNLINHFFSSSSSEVHDYFSFNAEPEPNWLGHLLLCLFNLILPSFVAEKLIMLIYIVSLPVVFRLLIKRVSPGNIYATYFIFPFIYTLMFYLGFYNFCLSISLLIYLLHYRYIRNDTVRSKVVFAGLLLLLYFAHLFSFLLFIAIDLYFYLWKTIKNKNNGFMLRRAIRNLLPYLPGLSLTVNFILKKGSDGSLSFLPASTLLTGLKESAPLITLNHDNEYFFTTFLSGTWLALFLVITGIRIKNKQGINVNDNWLLIACFILLAYFVLPDDAATGGYISMRIALFFLIFFVFWLAIHSIHKVIYFITALCCVTISLVLLNKHYNDSKLLSADASEMYSAVDFIAEGKNILPLNYSGNWLHANFSNYLGSEKNIIVLDNYEAAKPHFPLKWKENKCPYNVAGDFADSNSPCLTLERYEGVSGVKVDYITRWYYNVNITDSCTLLVNNLLQDKFEKVYTSPQQKMEVFKRVRI